MPFRIKSKKKRIKKLEDSFGIIKENSSDFDLISNYFRNKDNSDSFQTISDKTCNDLDFEDLFRFLDRTISKIGQQFLYNKLRTIPNDSKRIELEEQLIQKLTNDKELRINTQLQLNKLSKFEAFYISSLFQGEHTNPPKWFFIIPILSFTSLFSLILMPFNSNTFIVFLGVFIVNFGIHYWNKRHVNNYLDSLPQLLKLHTVATHLYKNSLLKQIDPHLDKSISIVNEVRTRMSFFKFDNKMLGEFEMISWTILELIKTAFLIEPLLLFGILKRLDTKRIEIENMYRFVGEVDTLISIASLRHGLGQYCLPVINKSSILSSEVYHPLIKNCIPNSIDVTDKSILLTGSNMSGKTSFIRTIGLNMITGLTINTCFAKSMTIPRLQIHSVIRISDDLINDRSYYFEEVLSIKNMLDKSSNDIPNLFLLDEIFKGTNTIERISAGKAVLSTLSKNNNIVLVSTHDIELTDMLTDEYELYNFSEIIKDNNVDFDYKLKEGKLKNRNAIRILQINDYPDEIIKEAISIADTLDKISVSTRNIYQSES